MAHTSEFGTYRKMHRAPVKLQQGLILGHHDPTELQQRQSCPYITNPDGTIRITFAIELVFLTPQSCCSGSEPSSSRLLRSRAKRCAASPPIVLRNSVAPIRSSIVKRLAVGALCSWPFEYACDGSNHAVSHPRGRPLAGTWIALPV